VAPDDPRQEGHLPGPNSLRPDIPPRPPRRGARMRIRREPLADKVI
jgi:hypothetical protein